MGATVQDDATAALAEARERTLALVRRIDDGDLARVHSTLMSPLVWDLGHIAAFEDLWIVHRLGGRPMLRGDLADTYDAFETPRAQRGTLDFLDPDGARAYLADVREAALDVLAAHDGRPSSIPELIVRHEHQHTETMLQTMELAGLRGFDPEPIPDVAPSGDAPTGLELVEVPGGRATIGAGATGFAYDNERPAHAVDVPAFAIGVIPVTNAAWREWTEAGGYRRREWWTEAGWRWREVAGIERPAGWDHDLVTESRLGETVALHPGRPVVHVSAHEAEAFVRAHGLRLPTEVEWETAARLDPATGHSAVDPWGDGPPTPGRHANVDQLSGGTAVAASLPADRAPSGARGLIGDVWEWTGSRFTGYPGFVAEPYPEYSEVFFGDAYRVLRGGSWATRARVATASFRNWDFPERRQIFAGLRVARDA